MHLQVEHRFSFEYDTFISESFLELRVQPKTTPQQSVASFELAVGPPTSVHRYRDWNDNLTHHFTITKFHDRIAVSARSLRYGASVIRDYLAALSGPNELTTPARIMGRLHADLRYDDEAQMRRGDFVGLLDRVVGELAKTHDAIATQYFVT